MNEREIFAKALEMPSEAEREAFLAEACGDDVRLRERIVALLGQVGELGDFLEEPAAGGDATLEFEVEPSDFKATPMNRGGTELFVPSEHVGSTIGPYKLLQELGQGGMGTVFMAEQEQPVRRRVALKVIKPGMDTRQVIARFEAERQALAMMDHNNIARVLDARATDSGRPYFVMELVKGVPITRYCDEHQLSARERLELFVPVCHAIQHAHQKGIIHRDIKPSNILVALYDGRAVPKVIDFGVAKAIQQKLTEKTMFTEMGQIVGTLEYMSPEQAEMNQLDVDTRSDVYSLGAVLYELLTGSTPFSRQQLREVGFTAMLRTIRESEPPKPSTRLSESADALPSISAQRRTEPAKLSRFVRGDLDWIVMKALDKDRTRRYDTTDALASDIQRFLGDDPVEAGPPSATYRMRKFVHKNRRSLSVAAALVVLLVAGTVVSTWQAISAHRSARIATRAEREATAERRKALAAEKDAREKQALAEAAEESASIERDRAVRSDKEARWNLYVARMQQVQNEWDQANLSKARELLDLYRNPASNEDDLRGVEWYYWDRTTHQELRTLRGHEKDISAMAFSHDGRLLASAEGRPIGSTSPSRGFDIKLWETGTGREFATLVGNDQSVLDVAFDNSGKYLASVSAGVMTEVGAEQHRVGGSIRLWDVTTGGQVHQFVDDSPSYRGIAFSPDGKYLATTTTDSKSQNGRVVIWSVADHSVAMSFSLKTAGKTTVTALAYAPDGATIAVCGVGLDGVQIYRSADGVFVQQLDISEDPDYRSGDLRVFPRRAPYCDILCYHPGGALMATNGHSSESILIWDLADGHIVRKMSAAGIVRDLATSANGRWIASADRGRTVRLWSWASGTELRVYKGHTSGVEAVALSSDGLRMASGGTDRTVKIWDLAGAMTLPLIGFTNTIRDAHFSGDGTRLAVAHEPGSSQVVVWDTTTGKQLRVLDEQTRCVRFDPPGRLLATGSKDNSLLLWNVESGQIDKRLQGHSGVITNAAFSPDGQLVASGDSKYVLGQRRNLPGELKVWDVASGKQLFSHHGYVNPIILSTKGYSNVSFSPDSRILAAIIASGDTGFGSLTIKLWDTSTWREMLTIPLKSRSARGIVFSPDGTTLTTTAMSDPLVFWQVPDGREAFSIEDEDGYFSSATFTRNETRIVTFGGGTKVWDATSGAHICTLDTGRPIHPPLSDDGSYALGLTSNRSFLWDFRPRPEQPSNEDEARRLVQFLARRPMLQADVASQLEQIGSISEPVRKRAIALSTQLLDHPQTFHEASWNIVQNASRDPADYEKGLRFAQIAVQLDSAEPQFLTTRGIAEYRSDQFEKAIETLEAARTMRPPSDNTVMELAFLAMTHHQLGNSDQAKVHLDQARGQVPQLEPRDESASFYREAAAMLGEPE